MLICKRYLITGRVQGVGYRAATVVKAQQLAITGWVKNLADGSVAVMACATEAQHQQLLAWLWQGPIRALVSQVDVQSEVFQEFLNFVQN